MMQRWTYIRVAVGLVLMLGVSPAMAASNKESIDKLATKYHEFRQFNGTVLVVGEKGIILKKAYGLANFEWQISATPDTKFRIASITKQFTSMVIMQLVAEGKVGLDDSLSKLLPDYRQDTGSRVTLTHLLNHTSGIPSFTNHPDFVAKASRNPFPAAELIKQLASGDLEFEPGTKYAYNNSGYYLLGAIIERVTGKPYAQVVQERIFDPVGMKNSGYDVSATVLPKRASGYVSTPDGLRNAPYINMDAPFAAGGLYSTVEDLYLWDRALHGDTLLPPALKQRMFTPGLQGYAFGWEVQSAKLDDGKTEVALQSHRGGVEGFSTIISRSPETKEAVIILSNVRGSNVQGLASGIWSLLRGVKPQAPRRSISEAVMTALAKGPITEAIATYRTLKAQKPDEYKFNPGELNRLGYQLMKEGRLADAVEIFKLNVEMYPTDGNVHDSLGEAYLARGDKALAAESYRRSLEFDPKNADAVRILKEIEQPSAKSP
ncbi:serine hydrolase domain-containing protein [Myxococcus xanthus]|uniref:serine hydrolase domain-containing protein n=1 Tax=Myxococcus xanthus TaxID=34 RepID=UPI00112D673E|nr:serine hydrolase domain-containing protein [Myxococcus xanthus]QDE81592.1 serine hydrolase [Myxococcus xanthus]